MADIAAPPSRIGTGETLSSLDVLGNSSLQGSLTVDGAFTSPGIDDNATSTQVTITDTSTTFAGDVTIAKASSANLTLSNTASGVSMIIGAQTTAARVTAGPGDTLGLGANNTADQVVIDSSGNLLVGVTSGTTNLITKDVTPNVGALVLEVGDTSPRTLAVYGVSTGFGAANAANAGVKIGQDTVTARSVNTSGTINASGTDYAEYELKADGCGDFAKGDIVGFDANGKLTDVFADAVSFAIKSTNPSYVGGDTWHDGLERPEKPAQAEDETDGDFAGRVTQWESDLAAFEAALEEKRQRVDRIAYAGKVPVNGIDANNSSPGDFVYASASGLEVISPVNQQDVDSATTVAGLKALMSKMIKERDRVGKVRCYGSDGRAIVEVKMG